MFCTFGHLPSRDENGSEYEAEHGEEHRDRANHPITAHLMNNNIIISNGKQNCISQIEGGGWYFVVCLRITNNIFSASNIIISNRKQNCISQIEGGVDIWLSVCGSLMIYLAHHILETLCVL